VTAHLTAAGEAKLLETTPVVEALNREQFRRLSAEQIATCLSLMGLIAAPAGDRPDSRSRSHTKPRASSGRALAAW
jgi:hypothetical protein